jgi:hypothetical protein
MRQAAPNVNCASFPSRLDANHLRERVSPADARGGGAHDYWTKPLDYERFMADVRRLVSDTDP